MPLGWFPIRRVVGGAARELFKKVFLSMRNVLVGTQCLRLY